MYMGYRYLKALNEEVLQAGATWQPHEHKESLILTYVIRGKLLHECADGSQQVIDQGQAHLLETGTVYRHREMNGSPTDEVHYIQAFIRPKQKALPPRAEAWQFSPNSHVENMILIASPTGENSSIRIDQDVKVWVGKASPGSDFIRPIPNRRYIWFQALSGSGVLNQVPYGTGDGLSLDAESKLQLTPQEETNFLFLDFS